MTEILTDDKPARHWCKWIGREPCESCGKPFPADVAGFLDSPRGKDWVSQPPPWAKPDEASS